MVSTTITWAALGDEEMHRLFIDEVGHDNLNSRDDPNERFLCLMGVIVDLEQANDVLEEKMNALKLAVFKTKNVVLHRREIINKRPPPFDVLATRATRAFFDQQLLDLIATCSYTAIAVLIDKKEHYDKYAVWHHHPYHYCLKAMLERYVMHLRSTGERGDVMVEWRGINPNRKLEAAYKTIYTRGTENMPGRQFQQALSSGQLKIRTKSANIAGLQLADLVANPACRYLICKKQQIPMTAPFGLKVVAILNDSKYRRCGWGDRTVEGYGTKCLP
jgi:Protein of unknown function (DUF3800)